MPLGNDVERLGRETLDNGGLLELVEGALS